MTRDELDLAIRRAQNLFDEWNDCTGAIQKGTGWYFEALSCIEDAVHCGTQAATGDYKTLPDEDDEYIATPTDCTDQSKPGEVDG